MARGYWQRFKTLEERFSEKVEKTAGCWFWRPTKAANQYGTIKVGERLVKAHRLSVEMHTGTKIPDGMCVLHKCDTPSCVNPDHLFVGDKKDNTADMWAKGRNAHNLQKRLMAKIDERQVRLIRLLRKFKQNEIAKIFGLDSSTISQIVTYKRWSAVQKEPRLISVSINGERRGS